MRGNNSRTTGIRFSKRLQASGCGDKELKRQLNPGDIAWTKFLDNSWWPAQVVDGKSISCAPKKKTKDDIPVRLYGTNEYLYVDPLKSSTEFENFLKQENISPKEAFERALEEDIRLVIGGKMKRKRSESKGNVSVETPKEKRQNHETIAGNQQADRPPPPGSFSGTQNEIKAGQQGKDAVVKIARNKGTEQVGGRKPVVSKRSKDEASRGNSVKLENEERERSGTSAIKATNQGSLRRSPRFNALKPVSQAESELPKYQEVEHCGSGNHYLAEKLKSCNSRTKGLKERDSGRKKHEDTVEEKGKVSGKCPGEKCIKLYVAGIHKGASKHKTIRQYPLRSKKLINVDKEIREMVILELAKERGKNTVHYATPHAPKESVNASKEDGLTEAKHQDAGEQKKQMVSKDTRKYKSRKNGEAGNQDGNVASKGKYLKQNVLRVLRQEKLEDARRHQNIDSPKSAKSPAPGETPDRFTRTARVMQSLGLIAPAGSPFRRNR